MSKTNNGGCQCGAVKFSASGAPKFVANCHCASCRKATGAAFSTWVGFLADRVKWQNEAPTFYASSETVQRGFCRQCGSPLTYAGAKWPGETHILIGAFDDPAIFTPHTEVFTDEALPWARKKMES